jgi:hypothetical protein
LTHDLLEGFMDSSSSSDALTIFPKVTIFGESGRESVVEEMIGGSGRVSVAEGMTDVSWVEDGLTISAEGVGSSSGMD